MKKMTITRYTYICCGIPWITAKKQATSGEHQKSYASNLTPNISPGLIWSHKHFSVGLYTLEEGGYTKAILCLDFFTPVICISRKRNKIGQKKPMLLSEMSFDSK